MFSVRGKVCLLGIHFSVKYNVEQNYNNIINSICLTFIVTVGDHDFFVPYNVNPVDLKSVDSTAKEA